MRGRGAVLALAALASGGTTAAQDSASCLRCHEKEARAEERTAHAGPAGSCVACHGGDGRATEKERAHGPDYRGKIGRAETPGLCARCHSDARKMNPRGLPIDAHALYLTSKHGESLQKGDLSVAVCTDCHGTHSIRRSRDPASPVHAHNVPSTCGRCHSNRDLMGKHGLPDDAERLFRESVHGGLLFKKGDFSAPQCATCHGNHGATPPGFAEVSLVCGKCHVREAESFASSPHAFYAKDGSFKGCVVCHSNHRIVGAPAEILTRCGPCHEEPDKEMKKGRALAALLSAARDSFSGTERRLAEFARRGLPTELEQGLLEQARTALLQMPSLQHTLDEAKVTAQAREVRAVLGAVEGGLDRKERESRVRKLALVPVWAFLLGMAAIFWAKHRQVERKAAGQGGPGG